jgi:di/tricarboxylate transporter
MHAMTTDIAIVLAILVVAIVLFITERIRPDVVALLVLVSLALTGLVTPTEALSGFANLAVVTVWAVLILSGGLARTGVASGLGRQVLRFAGHSEARLIAVIMVTVGVLSGFMNDIGVAALMLPVVVDIAHRLGRPPSRLLMPLAFAALLVLQPYLARVVHQSAHCTCYGGQNGLQSLSSPGLLSEISG